MIKWKTLCNKICRSCFIEFRTVKFVFFFIFIRFYIDFISSLFNTPWAPGPKCNFFTFRSCRPLDGRQAPCRPLGGRQAPIFENFTIWHIFLKFYFLKNIKMKKVRFDIISSLYEKIINSRMYNLVVHQFFFTKIVDTIFRCINKYLNIVLTISAARRL